MHTEQACEEGEIYISLISLFEINGESTKRLLVSTSSWSVVDQLILVWTSRTEVSQIQFINLFDLSWYYRPLNIYNTNLIAPYDTKWNVPPIRHTKVGE